MRNVRSQRWHSTLASIISELQNHSQHPQYAYKSIWRVLGQHVDNQRLPLCQIEVSSDAEWGQNGRLDALLGVQDACNLLYSGPKWRIYLAGSCVSRTAAAVATEWTQKALWAILLKCPISHLEASIWSLNWPKVIVTEFTLSRNSLKTL